MPGVSRAFFMPPESSFFISPGMTLFHAPGEVFFIPPEWALSMPSEQAFFMSPEWAFSCPRSRSSSYPRHSDKSAFIFSFSCDFGQNKDIRAFIFQPFLWNHADFSNLNAQNAFISSQSSFSKKNKCIFVVISCRPVKSPAVHQTQPRRRPRRQVRSSPK